uniref:hypothetical protein n=1 Tax=Mangrovimonas sp. TPBH4 TaxID=1645914 RepID=UPI000AB5E3DF
MTLKKKIFIDKYLIPITLLTVLIIYIIKEGAYMFREFYGFYLFYFVIWFLISLMIISKSNNHLINYSIDKEFINVTFYKNFKTIQ